MFTLTEAGRENLEAIHSEFLRAAGSYSPLYHERLIPWSEHASPFMSDAQWQAFIDAESANVAGDDWWEWDGPYSAEPGFSGWCLGRWFGHPDGMQEFINLVDSATTVLQSEEFSEVGDTEIPFAFSSFNQWMSTLHTWAFRFQMPLLRCDMNRWGAEDADLDQFNDLGELWRRTENSDYPVHPVCWTLIDNVFTSSATAIRTILRPDNVVTTNEPWPTDNSSIRRSVVRPFEQLETAQQNADAAETISSHRIVLGPLGWTIEPAGSGQTSSTKFQSGLHRIAALIEHSSKEFDPKELAGYGGRSTKMSSRVLSAHDLDEGHSLRLRNRIGLKQDQDDEQGRRDAKNELLEWIEVKTKAEATGNKMELEEAEEHIESIRKQFNVTEDGTIKPQRPFRDKNDKNAKDTVSTTMKKAVADLKKQLPELESEFDRLLAQITFSKPTLKFEPNPEWTNWTVVRQV